MNFLSSALKKLTTSGGFVPEKLSFSEDGSLSVVTTALLAEGGYSYVYSAREVSVSPQQFAAKKVLAQDKDTCSVAEVETKVLQQLTGHPGFVKCFGAMSRTLPDRRAREYWMLLEFCPNGSLIDVLYRKGKGGAFEKKPPLS